MKLGYIEDVAKQNLGSEERRCIDNLVNEYLKETTKEHLATTIGAIYQDIKKSYEFRILTTNDEKEFWDEVIRFWHFAESKYFKSYIHIRGELPFSYDYHKKTVEDMLKAIYGDTLQAMRIARHETLGGIPAVIEQMFKKMEKNAKQIYVHIQIDKFFKSYRNSLYAIQYIAVRYLLTYSPDLIDSEYNDFLWCKYDSRENRYMTFDGLDHILTMHLRESE